MRTAIRALAVLLLTPAFALGQTTPQSDDFNGCGALKYFWSAIDPLSDSPIQLVGGGSPDAALEISVAGGVSHEPWESSNTAPRLMQATDDVDFSISTRLETLPTLRYQEQGLLVEQDATNWIRFDVYSTGSTLRLIAASATNGSMQVHRDRSVTLSTPAFLRVTRTGDSWAFDISNDGVNWVNRASFVHSLSVTSTGVFAGNAGPAPAYVARFDYFEEAAAPIVNEDGGSTGPFDVDVTMSGAGSGQVVLDPPTGPYPCGSTVTLTAVPNPGSQFASWSGAASGADQVVSIVVSAEMSIGAEFESDVPATISDLDVTVGATSALVTWTTDEPATSNVDYGVGSLGSSAGSPDLVREHAVLLSGLTPDTLYEYQVSSIDFGGTPATAPQQSFLTNDASPFASDSFNGCGPLSTLWTAEDPQNDATIALVSGGSQDASLQIDVAGGTPHVPWGIFDAPRAMQPSSDASQFTVTTKLLTLPSVKFQMQGLAIEEGPLDWLRCEIYSKGSKMYCFMVSTVNGASQGVLQQRVTLTAPAYLRVTRDGVAWTQEYSQDGTNWSSIGTYVRPMTVSRVGVFAGNAGASPAYTARFDYIEESRDPLLVEDSATVGPFDVTATTSGSGTGAVTFDPPGPYACGQVVTITAAPAVGSQFAGWSGALAGQTNPATLEIFGNESVNATFGPDVAPTITDLDVASELNEVTISWDTDEPADALIEYGLTPALGMSVSRSTYEREHSLTITGLAEATQYYYRVSAADAGGLTTTLSDLSFWTATPLTDDFSRPNLGQDWELVDPHGVGRLRMEGAAANDGRLALEIPAGTTYDTWYANEALRVRRSIDDEDLDFAVGIGSAFAADFQMQGMMFEDADGVGFVRMEVFHDGSGLRAFASSNVGGSSTAHINVPLLSGAVPSSQPMFVRVRRVGDDWTLFTSTAFDPQQPLAGWTDHGTFTRSTELARIALHAGCAGSRPGITASFDWFADLTDPPLLEDQFVEPDVFGPLQYLVANGAPSVQNVSFEWATDEPATGEVRYGLSPALGSSVFTAGSGYDHAITVTGLLPTSTYYFRLVSTDGLGQETVSDEIVLTTLSGSPPIFEIFDAEALGNGQGVTLRFGHRGQPQRFANIRGNVSDADGFILPNSLYYTLNGGPQVELTLGADPFRLIEPGDFNCDIRVDQLQVGSNVVEIHATDDQGLEQVQRVLVSYDDVPEWPFEAVDFTVDSLLNSAQIVDGRWESTPDGIHPVVAGYDRLITIGDRRTWTEYQVTMTFRIAWRAQPSDLPPNQGAGPAVGLGVRWDGHNETPRQPDREYWPTGGFTWFQWSDSGDRLELYANENSQSSQIFANMDLDRDYVLRFTVENVPGGSGGEAVYTTELWEDSIDDPAAPDWSRTVTGLASAPTHGAALIIAHHVDAYIKAFDVVDLSDN
ncbi:MAG: fibronectin type III domain-containing protein [Planctomycetota bacterium]